MKDPVLYVLINKGLNMSPGKAAAQAVHATANLAYALGEEFDFTDSYRRAVVVLAAENQQQMENLQEYLDTAEIQSTYYIDEGVNEVGAYSITALAVEPVDAADERTREIFSAFKLYGSEEQDEEDYYDGYQEPSETERLASAVNQLTLAVSRATPAPKEKKPSLWVRFKTRKSRRRVS